MTEANTSNGVFSFSWPVGAFTAALYMRLMDHDHFRIDWAPAYPLQWTASMVEQHLAGQRRALAELAARHAGLMGLHAR